MAPPFDPRRLSEMNGGAFRYLNYHSGRVAVTAGKTLLAALILILEPVALGLRSLETLFMTWTGEHSGSQAVPMLVRGPMVVLQTVRDGLQIVGASLGRLVLWLRTPMVHIVGRLQSLEAALAVRATTLDQPR